MDAKDEVKNRLSIEEVIGDYLELKRAGRNLKALSPFTGEKTASFMVSPDKQIWHDFSSNQGGDIFSFIMLMEGVDFRGALEILARKAGVDLAQYSQGDSRVAKRKKRIFEANDLAARYYQKSLVKNSEALDYVVKKRGYGKKLVEDFRIGYAPRSSSALQNFLRKRDFSANEIKDAGLASSSGRDMFRGRLMIPLCDGQGRIVGFTARVLDNSLPKYINTPQTLVYDKGRQVFGLHLAKDVIRKLKYVVVVEGNLDVIASHKTSVKNVVASAGTAITKDHLLQLSRLTNDVRLAFDSDSAGLAATERSIPLAQEAGVRLSIIDIPSGKDPDELIKKDPGLWEKSVTSSKYVVDWLVDHYQKLHDISTAEGKKRFSDTVLTVLARVIDPVEQEHYIKRVAELSGVSSSSVEKKFAYIRQSNQKRRRRYGKPTVKPEQQEAQSAYQDLLLGLNMLYPDVQRSIKDIKPDQLEGDKRQMVMNYLLANTGKRIVNVPEDLREIDDYVKIILFKTEELYDDWPASDRMIEAIGLARRLNRDTQQKRKKNLSREIQAAEEAGDTKRRESLLKEFNELLKERS